VQESCPENTASTNAIVTAPLRDTKGDHLRPLASTVVSEAVFVSSMFSTVRGSRHERENGLAARARSRFGFLGNIIKNLESIPWTACQMPAIVAGCGLDKIGCPNKPCNPALDLGIMPKCKYCAEPADC